VRDPVLGLDPGLGGRGLLLGRLRAPSDDGARRDGAASAAGVSHRFTRHDDQSVRACVGAWFTPTLTKGDR
jgi:hypothetical protein